MTGLFAGAHRRAAGAGMVALILVAGAASAGDTTGDQGTRTEGIPPIPATLTQRLRAYENIRFALAQDWLADGSGILLTSRFAETEQVHLVNAPGGARTQLTFFAEPVTGVAACPDRAKSTFLFTRDSGGNENFQIYLFDRSTLRSTLMTDGASVNDGMLWSPRGDCFVYSSTRRNGRDFDLYLCQTGDTVRTRLLLTCTGAWSADDWSPDGKRLLVTEEVSRNESRCYLLTVATGELRPVLNAPGVCCESPVFGPGGTGFFFVADDSSDLKRLEYRDLASGKTRVVAKDVPNDILGIALSRDRKMGAFVTNDHGYSGLFLIDTRTMRWKRVEPFPCAIVKGLRFAPDGSRIGFSLDAPQSPADVYTLDVKTLRLTRWTFSEMGGMDTSGFCRPDIITYPTFDSTANGPRRIPAFYFRPRGPGPFPVVISIHGGPESQFWPSFSAQVQFWVREMGIAVVAPDVRGSNGYGKAYLLLDNGYLRENALKDIGALLDWIGTRRELDTSRVAVTGGSYGGYLSLASMIRYGARLRAGIDVVGIANFVTFLENTKGYRRDLRRVEYGDERDPEMRKFLLSISPVTGAARITRPLLIIHGVNDPRVPVEEARQIAAAVRKNGGDVWFLLAEDEGHGFRKKSRQDFQQAATALFLERALGLNVFSPNNSAR